MVSSILGVRGTSPVKKLDGTDTMNGRHGVYLLLLLYVVVVVVVAAAAAVLLLLLYLLLWTEPYVKQRVARNGNNYPIIGATGILKFTKKLNTCGCPSHPLGEGESNTLLS